MYRPESGGRKVSYAIAPSVHQVSTTPSDTQTPAGTLPRRIRSTSATISGIARTRPQSGSIFDSEPPLKGNPRPVSAPVTAAKDSATQAGIRRTFANVSLPAEVSVDRDHSHHAPYRARGTRKIQARLRRSGRIKTETATPTRKG